MVQKANCAPVPFSLGSCDPNLPLGQVGSESLISQRRVLEPSIYCTKTVWRARYSSGFQPSMFFPPGDIWQYLEILETLGGAPGNLVGKDQGG